MPALATAIVNTTALWKIILASLVGGAGVALAFGVLLLGLSRARRSHNAAGRLVDYLIATLAGAFCIAAVALGIYAMAKKPASSKSKKGKASAALVVPGHRQRLVA